jgi:hypothetical protein
MVYINLGAFALEGTRGLRFETDRSSSLVNFRVTFSGICLRKGYE